MLRKKLIIFCLSKKKIPKEKYFFFSKQKLINFLLRGILDLFHDCQERGDVQISKKQKERKEKIFLS